MIKTGSNYCPLCNQEIASLKTKIHIDLSSNIAISENKWVQLTNREAEIAHILTEVPKKFCSSDYLMKRLLGQYDEKKHRNFLSAIIRRLRPKLRLIGIEIRTIRNRGYSLIIIDD